MVFRLSSSVLLLSEWFLWEGSSAGPDCAIEPSYWVWNRVHVSLSPRLSCINVFCVSNQTNTESTDSVETMYSTATFELL